MSADDAWMRDPDTLDRLIRAALAAHDFECVVTALRLLAVVDPHRAELLHDTMLLGLSLAKAGEPS